MPQTGKSAVSPDRSVVLRYAGAAMAALAALGVRMALDPMLGSQAPYLPFIIAIVVASRYGGRGPGLAATAISAAAVDWFYLQPRSSLAIADRNAVASLALFVLTGVIISFFTGRLRKSLLSAARAEPVPRSTGEQIHHSPGSPLRFRGADHKVKPHYLWLGAAVLLLAIEGVLFFGTWTRFAERESLSIRTREVLAKIESLLSELKDAETGQRGYLLTGQDSYLAPYNAAVQAIPGQLEELRKLTLDAGQQARIVSLRPLIGAKLAELKETIDLRRSGAAAAALQVISTDRGKQTMDQIRDVIASMRAAETSLLEERSQRAADAARGMGLVMASGAGLLLIVLLAGSRDIDRNLARRQQAQEKLHASEEKFAKVFATNPAALAITRLEDGYVVDVNEAWQAMMGHSRDEAAGRSTLDLHTWPAREERDRCAVELKEKGSISGQEVTLLRKSGEPFTALLSAVTLTIGGEEAILSAWLDISGRKRAEEALRESEERFRVQVTAGTDVVYRMSPDWSEMRQLRGRDFIADTDAPELGWLQKYIHPDDQQEVKEAINQAIRTKSTFALEHRVLRVDGSLGWTFSRAVPRLENGEIIEWLGGASDITERRRAEEEIRQLNAELEDRVRRRTAELEAANKELEAFAYSVSHDLRTPLRGIDGWSLALVEDYAGQLDERAHGYVDRVRAETQRMGALIDDLLQLSRVTRSEMAAGAVDLTAIARTIAARLAEDNSGRRIEFTIAGGLTGNGDARLLEIALENLFGNAVKFTGPRADARIEFGRAEGDGERPFFVRDNGVGFDMAFAGTLFGAFQRLHKSSEFPGTGIGLATVQRIIHRHGGRVWAEAQPDRGAIFYFTLGGL